MKKKNNINNIILLKFRFAAIRYLLFYILTVTAIASYGQYGGSTCESAQTAPISFTAGIPFVHGNETLYNQGNEYNSLNTGLLPSFSPYYLDGPDYVYYFSASSTGSVTIQITYGSPSTRCLSVSLFESGSGYSLGNHISGSYDVASDDQPGLLTIGNVSEGASYYIVVDGNINCMDTVNNSQYGIKVFYNPISVPCTNFGFENGNFNNWFGTSGIIQDCVNQMAEHANYCPTVYGTNTSQLSIINGGTDPYGGFPCVFEGDYVAMIGDGTGNGSKGGQLITTFEVSPASDFVTLNYAMVVNDGHHRDTSQSYIQINMLDQNGLPIACGDYLAIAGKEGLGFTESPTDTNVTFCQWQSVPTDLSDYTGQKITIIVTVGDCAFGAHFAYAYLDCACTSAELITSGCYPLNLSAPSSFDSYLWAPGGDTTQTIENISAGTYCCEMTRNNCTINVCKDVIIEPLDYTLTTVNSDCNGRDNGSANIHINGGIADYGYFWSDSCYLVNTTLTGFSVDSLHSGTYFVTLTDGLGCTYSEPFEILNNYEIATNYNVNQNAGCYGYSDGIATISTDNINPPYTFLWPDSSSSEINSNLYAGTHVVTVTDNIGCSITLSVEISQPDQLNVPEFNTTIRNGCQPLEIVFSLVENSYGYTYVWNFTDGVNTYETNGPNPGITFLHEGNYNFTLYYTDENSCVDSSYFRNFVRVYPKPDVSFYPDPEKTDILHPVFTFNNQSSGAINYFWNFGDGNTSSVVSPWHQYNSTGSFWVELVAFTDKGCFDSTGLYVYVSDAFTFYAPTAFTPDLNGINEIFKVVGTGIDNDTFNLYVFDRWGELIFQTSDIENGWDGTVKDRFTKAPVGVYYWLAEFRDIMGRAHGYSGEVNVVK